MIAADGLRWILTLVFAVPVGYGLWRLALPATNLAARVDHALHAAMGALMAAMAWPWGMDLPAVPQVVVFTAGALWFVAAAPFRAGARSRAGAVMAAWPHALMTGAMAWMVAAMGSSGAMAGHGGAGGHHDMPGMDMSDGSGLASMSLAGTGPRTVAGLLALVLAVLGVVWLARAFDHARLRQPVVAAGAPVPVADAAFAALEPACHAAMALGMAVMFVLLV
ncbi:DUF5134 domain-containing protein [Streptomyces achromogenes]|uniref:DUF5134 domain-containing protein n=1 Tax=Streptomyces achromogenes TaxID=67255 RepID=UPI0033C230A0